MNNPKPLHAVDGGDDPATEDDLDYDFEALRKTPHAALNVERAVLSVPLRKPKPDEFFRTHVDPSYMQDVPLLQVEINDRKEQYWVAPRYRPEVAHRLTTFRLVACLNRAMSPFVWAINMGDASVNRRWRDTSLTIVEAGQTCWVAKVAGQGAHELVRAKGDLGEPQWPEDMSFDDMLKLVFKADDRTIRDDDHYAIKYINGQT